jgi:hypothetical protein
MTAADLHRFLVVCALVSDLYCPGYNPKQPLAKDSNLARTAVRYKVDTAKMVAIIQAELSKTKSSRRRRRATGTNSGNGTIKCRKTLTQKQQK